MVNRSVGFLKGSQTTLLITMLVVLCHCEERSSDSSGLLNKITGFFKSGAHWPTISITRYESPQNNAVENSNRRINKLVIPQNSPSVQNELQDQITKSVILDEITAYPPGSSFLINPDANQSLNPVLVALPYKKTKENKLQSSNVGKKWSPVVKTKSAAILSENEKTVKNVTIIGSPSNNSFQIRNPFGTNLWSHLQTQAVSNRLIPSSTARHNFFANSRRPPGMGPGSTSKKPFFFFPFFRKNRGYKPIPGNHIFRSKEFANAPPPLPPRLQMQNPTLVTYSRPQPMNHLADSDPLKLNLRQSKTKNFPPAMIALKIPNSATAPPAIVLTSTGGQQTSLTSNKITNYQPQWSGNLNHATRMIPSRPVLPRKPTSFVVQFDKHHSDTQSGSSNTGYISVTPLPSLAFQFLNISKVSQPFRILPPKHIKLKSEHWPGLRHHAVTKVVSTVSTPQLESQTPSTSGFTKYPEVNEKLTTKHNYPDPPTPPRLLDMNTIYELTTQSTFPASTQLQEQTNKTEGRQIFQEHTRSFKTPRPYIPYKLGKIYDVYNNRNKKRKYFKETKQSLHQKASESYSSPKNSTSAYKSLSMISSFDTMGSSDVYKLMSEKSEKLKKSFRPSPQVHSFEEPTTGIRSFISVLPGDAKSLKNTESTGGDSILDTMLRGSEAKHYTPSHGIKSYNDFSGFKPSSLSYYNVPTFTTSHWVNKNKDINTYDHSRITTTSLPFPHDSGEKSHLVKSSLYELVYGKKGLSTSFKHNFGDESTKNKNIINIVTSSHGHNRFASSKAHQTENVLSSSSSVKTWKKHAPGIDRNQSSTHDSAKTTGAKFNQGRPNGCKKFSKYGFCPVTIHYPKDKVKALISKCSSLMSHLIAPLPSNNTRYETIKKTPNEMMANEDTLVGVTEVSKHSWNMKKYIGKPTCDTKDLKVLPGWARNEKGEWMTVLQSESWRQEAQVTLCTSRGAFCHGASCSKTTLKNFECVQRFSAQRVAVLNSKDFEKCPVIRSVFLPSACVCLSTLDNPDAERKANNETKAMQRGERKHVMNDNLDHSDQISGLKTLTGGNDAVTNPFGTTEILPTEIFPIDLGMVADSSETFTTIVPFSNAFHR